MADLSPMFRFKAAIDAARAIEALKVAVDALAAAAARGDDYARDAIRRVDEALQADPPILEQMAREAEQEGTTG